MRRSQILVHAAALAALTATAAVAQTAPITRQPSLKVAFREHFLVGAALNPDQFSGTDTIGVQLITRHFNTITPENHLKWQHVHPEPGRYDFGPADRYVEFGEKHGMFIVGHTLVWHSQTPAWVFQDRGQPASRDTLLARMKDHIRTVAGRYKGRIHGWDVVNEALNEDGTMRPSPWQRIIGDDFIVEAFKTAQEVDPAAELYYNDYSLANPAKRDGAIRLVERLRAAGVRVAGIGSQDHHNMTWPAPALVDSMLTKFAQAGVRVHLTELDIDVLPRVTRQTGADIANRGTATAASNPYAAGLPDSAQQALATRYREIFEIYAKHRDVIDRVTFWGVRDGDSWLNDWPARGRTNHPLLFDRAGQPKRAFHTVLETARRAPTPVVP
ncbi:MAG TPA: endo-1,4-beta-xylanase [Gemmatimonadaceae bacterium]|nr:endo-1,4-beta-xylanase [Gemmatimonadaceae bacterium]